jgi:hypothetical protein
MSKDFKNKYDCVPTGRLNHLKIHPAYLPHIGENYDTSNTKIMVIAESHYVHFKHNNKSE